MTVHLIKVIATITILLLMILYLLLKSHVPTTSMPVSHGPGAKFLSRAQMNLHLVQCHLDHQGASKLIVDLVIKSSNNTKIFAEVVELGIGKSVL